MVAEFGNGYLSKNFAIFAAIDAVAPAVMHVNIQCPLAPE